MVESFLMIFPRVHQPLRKSYLCSHCPRQTRVSVLNSHNDVWRPNEHWTASCFGRICEGRTRAPSQHSLEQAESDASSIDSVTKVNQYCSSDLHVLKSKTWDIDIFRDIEKISPDISNFVLGYLELFPGISGKIFRRFYVIFVAKPTWQYWGTEVTSERIAELNSRGIGPPDWCSSVPLSKQAPCCRTAPR